jgi:hypothetical protein
LGAFFAAPPQKTGLYAPIPQPPAGPCRGLPVFPLLSLARANIRSHADFRLSEFALHANSKKWKQPTSCRPKAAAFVPFLSLEFLLRKNSKNRKQPTSCRPSCHFWASVPFFASLACPEFCGAKLRKTKKA